jgi:hypothetical protein
MIRRLYLGGAMSTSQRVKEIIQILRNDPRRYWGDPNLQRELRETFAALHGEEEDVATTEAFVTIAPEGA